jgi:hypothetical protein
MQCSSENCERQCAPDKKVCTQCANKNRVREHRKKHTADFRRTRADALRKQEEMAGSPNGISAADIDTMKVTVATLSAQLQALQARKAATDFGLPADVEAKRRELESIQNKWARGARTAFNSAWVFTYNNTASVTSDKFPYMYDEDGNKFDF